ncbi:hypothetical protein [Rubinisphaera sp.]|uniref:hypothetical protein n=1 Tax=Rubinisphaera sp. TaxID=2024857 RepID=UPI000EE367FA|nr:hypothetical protein [Rubinisphaera sp.]HCS53848.1 hypothetical protein [Planctomycetaceae bacterium]
MASQDLGLINVIDRTFVDRDRRRPNTFPCLHHTPTMISVSDYAGSHKSSAFECYSFAILGDPDFALWDDRRIEWRHRQSLGRRTFAYKKLGDKKKAVLLSEFLNLVGDLCGVCVSFLVDRRLNGLFDGDGESDRTIVAEQWPKAKYRKATFDRLLRVTHFNSFVLAGLVGPHQNVLWITDQDDIAANERQLRALTEIFGSGMCRYLILPDGTLPFRLGHIRCGTTASDNGTLQCEDIASIPDLVGGALSEVFTKYSDTGIRLRKGIDLSPPADVSLKTRSIMGWMTEEHRLKQVVVCIEPAPSPSLFTVTLVDFIGSPLS